MKIVTGLFTPDNARKAVRDLREHDFSFEDLSLMSSAAEMPDFLEGDQAEAAASGAVAGAVTGSTLGALGTAAASTIPGFESMFVTGLMATAVGGVVGGYLGSLYSVRGESQTEIDIHEALEAGKILLVVKADGRSAETAVSLLIQNHGENVERHNISE